MNEKTFIELQSEKACEIMNHRFETGAVRSTDANQTRYDLITPIGLSALADNYYDCKKLIPENATVETILSEAIEEIYIFLSGDRDYEHLAYAACHICEAIHLNERGKLTPKNHDYGYALISYEALKALAETYHEGSIKYGDYNWELGFPVHDLLNHAIRHIYIWLDGDRSENHLGHILWNVLAAIHSYRLWPMLNEKHLRTEGCKPPIT